MACPRKNGIRYPLELDYLQPQASDTPRFPSRQAAFLHELHELKVKDTTGKVKREEKQVKDSLYFSFCRSEKGGDQEMKNEKYMGREDLIILNKLGNLGKVDEQSSVQQVQHKSIKSLSSLRERLANRSASKKIRQIRQIVKNRQKKTMSSLISIKFESPARKKQQEDKKQDKSTKPNSKHKSTLKKYYNNDKNIKIKALQDHQDQNRKLQLESKLNSDKKKLDKRNFFDKGRSLKSLLMRTKPNLQIKNRFLSNSKLQNFSQIVQSFLQNS